MKKSILHILLGAIIVLFAFQSCENDDDGDKISSYDSTESHKSGQDCMTCHKSGGSGEGIFTVAGTVYDGSQSTVYPNATVKLYSGENGTGTLISTIEVDGYGNFYTTEKVEFGTGLYTLVEGNLGEKNMIASITTGACNSCHGASTDPVWVE